MSDKQNSPSAVGIQGAISLWRERFVKKAVLIREWKTSGMMDGDSDGWWEYRENEKWWIAKHVFSRNALTQGSYDLMLKPTF